MCWNRCIYILCRIFDTHFLAHKYCPSHKHKHTHERKSKSKLIHLHKSSDICIAFHVTYALASCTHNSMSSAIYSFIHTHICWCIYKFTSVWVFKSALSESKAKDAKTGPARHVYFYIYLKCTSLFKSAHCSIWRFEEAEQRRDNRSCAT